MTFLSRIPWWVIPVLTGIIYLLLPNHNPGNDAWAYAAAARWGSEVFSPHHLLYNVPGRIWSLASGGWNVMEFMQALNALSAALSLALLTRLAPPQSDSRWLPLAQFFAGSTFSVLYYATENEAYMLPIPLMLGALIQIRNIQNPRAWLMAGCLLTLAFLFHQQHLMSFLAFATVAMLNRDQRWNRLLFLSIPFAVLVPVAYYFAWVQEPLLESPFQYFFHDFYQGSATWVAGSKHWILAPVNLVRIFIFLHGDIAAVLIQNPALGMTGMAGAALLVWGGWIIGRNSIPSLWHSIASWGKKIRMDNLKEPSFSPHLILTVLILLLLLFHLVFALWFGANHEFMLPIPVLLSLLWLYRPGLIPAKGLFFFSVGMLAWNLSFSTIPKRFYRTDPSLALAQMIEQYPNDAWILFDESRIRHIMVYFSGKQPGNLLHGPEWYIETGRYPAQLNDLITELHQGGYRIYSDCPGRPRPLNRASLTRADASEFWTAWEIIRIGEIKTLSESYPVSQILPLRAERRAD